MIALALGYIVLSIIAGIYGNERSLGFWGFFIASLIVSPVVTLFFLMLTKDKSHRRSA